MQVLVAQHLTRQADLEVPGYLTNPVNLIGCRGFGCNCKMRLAPLIVDNPLGLDNLPSNMEAAGNTKSHGRDNELHSMAEKMSEKQMKEMAQGHSQGAATLSTSMQVQIEKGNYEAGIPFESTTHGQR